MCREKGWPVIGLVVGLPPNRAALFHDLLARNDAFIIELPAKEDTPELYFKVDGHWNAAGHAHAASRVMHALDALHLGIK